MGLFQAGEEAAQRPSITALAEDIVDTPPMAPVDLTDELEALAGPSLSPRDIAAARASERFGRPFRSEAGTPGDPDLLRTITNLAGEGAPPSISKATAQQAVSGIDRDVAKKLREGGRLTEKDFSGLRKTGKLPASSVEETERQMREVDKQMQMFGGVGGFDEAGEFVRPSDRSPVRWDDALQRFVRDNLSQAAM